MEQQLLLSPQLLLQLLWWRRLRRLRLQLRLRRLRLQLRLRRLRLPQLLLLLLQQQQLARELRSRWARRRAECRELRDCRVVPRLKVRQRQGGRV